MSAFDSGEQALLAGFLVGVAARHGITLTPDVDAEGNYQNRFKVDAPELEEKGLTIYIHVSESEQ